MGGVVVRERERTREEGRAVLNEFSDLCSITSLVRWMMCSINH